MRRLLLALLAWAGGCGRGALLVDAASVSAFVWSNDTAHATADLTLTLDATDAPIPADAQLRFALSARIDVPLGAAVEAPSLDGSLDVALGDHVVVLSRRGDGSELPAGATLHFAVRGLRTPTQAGAVAIGSLVVSDASNATIFQVALPTVLVKPGAIWNTNAAFGSILSGRATTLRIELEPANAIPNNGALVVTMPGMYGSLESATLESVLGLDGNVAFSTRMNEMSVARVGGTGTSTSGGTQLIVLQFSNIKHPLLEGPVGNHIRVETLDGEKQMIDQTYIDTSSIVLQKARVVLSTRYLQVQNGSSVQSEYTLRLSAPPTGDQVTIMMSQSPGSNSSTVTLTPDRAVFTLSNWSVPFAIAVVASAGSTPISGLVSGVTVLIAHTILEAATSEPTFASVDSVQVLVVCPAGFDCLQCPGKPISCRDGTYALAGDTFCSACPRGYACPRTDQQPQACSPGTYSEANSTVCTSCPVGFSCAIASELPVPCASGTYASTPRSLTCTPCPAGHSCANGATIALCSAGTYSLEGESDCRPCPKGYRCQATNVSPVRCSVGTYSPLGSAECFPCLAGQYCPDPSIDPIPCPAWHYSGASSTSCTPCPAGHDCTIMSAPPPFCPAGTFSLLAGVPCEKCPAGAACRDPTSLPENCTPGTFSIGGQTQCTLCAPGFYCPYTNQNTQIACGDGTYAESGSAKCITCPIGKQCPSTTQRIEQVCPQGTFSLGGQSQCTSCPRGYKCPQADGSKNALCPLGTYSAGSSITCTTCPAGFACPDPSSDTPIPCQPGTYSVGGMSVCTSCSPGYACPNTTSSQRIQCGAGSYATGGDATCTPCPAGYQCLLTNSSSFQPCSQGWYSPAGSPACIQCPRGYFCDAPGEMPKNCSVGSYSLNGSTSCIACDPGYECPRSDQLPQPCPVGYYSEGGVANCKACKPGYKCGLASTNPTPPKDECPMGGYCNPTTTFFLCPAGTFGNVTGGESVDHACAICPEGSYCEMGSTPLTKQVCPPGFFCPEATKRASQYPCPSGTYNRLPGQKSRDACHVCPAGYFCEQGSAEPEICPHGYYCLEATGSADQYPCPAGTFSGPQTGLVLASQCEQCEIGSYCPEASSTPTKCPAGTYNPSVGSAGEHECLSCPPGWSCPRVGQSTFEDRCAPGHYCPSKTVLATAKPCPAGTYTERYDLIRAEDCTICPLRHACPQGTGGETQTMLACGPGFFCPNGTAYAKQFPCLPGTWSSSTSLADASECDVCPKGKYCVGGKSFIDGNCSPGYYCPLGTESATKFPCPSGTYTSKTWLFEASQCDDCPPGYYCPAGSVEPIPCKPGSYTSVNKTERVGPASAWPSCTTCPEGYFCVEASVAPEPCGKGKFSIAGSKACLPCEAGYFCNSATTSYANMKSDTVGWAAPGALYGKCYNGTYCPPGSDSEPALAADACPAGYYCPTATPQPMICPAGTYSNFTGQDAIDDCVPTPAGYFSVEGALAPTGECAAGFYCPLRSTSRTQVPCPARYYLNRTGGRSEDDCALCIAGSYCPKGSAFPTSCPAGSYCRTGVAVPEPCPIGTYANSSGLRQVEDCILCSPGMYCDSTALTLPRGPCDPGYYCTLGAYTSAPMNFELAIFGVSNRHTGAQCPPGAYCPLGSAIPTLCPPGTFNNFTGLETENQCVPCPPGRYCETPGLFLPTGECFAGYYCTGGARNATQFASPPGFYSLAGATGPTPCPLGQFNLHATQAQCVECPAGFYCGSSGTVQPVVCPPGNYCPKNSALPLKCSPGTFSSVEGLVAENQCEPCPAGYFCDSFGLSAPSGKCFEGFVCTHSSPVANPVGQAFGFICPAGHYCPEGSGAGVQCPNGTFRASIGGTNVSSCAPCPGGFYCGGTALIAPTDKCAEGYFCVSRASSASPTDGVTGDVCPPGFFCTSGTIDPVRCVAGTYALEAGQSSCTPCPGGYFCDGIATNRLFDCPMGHYCPVGTMAIPLPCPLGTFSERIKLTNVTECLACTPGLYCGDEGLNAPSGVCSAGFYCPPASENKFGKTVSISSRLCPIGAYCPEGTYVPIPCPSGTYSNNTGLASANECTYCDEGSYCAAPGLTTPTGPCAAGHYCKHNNTIPNPSTGVITTSGDLVLVMLFGGARCPVGNYCIVGSVSPRQCPEGTYADEIGASVCKACAPGYYCPLGSATYSNNLCPQGYFCPEGTKRSTEFPCPPGTFGNTTGLQREAQCSPAPGGMYVNTFGAVEPSGYCKSGYYCSGGSMSNAPSLGVSGGPCLPGTNCPEGSAVPIVCDAGYYCTSTNTEKALPCDEGFYCVQGSYTANPTGQNNSLGIIGDVCTKGHYCPQGTSNPIPCPPGTYSGTTQKTDPEDCIPCLPGYLCPASGTTLPTVKCPPGFICTGGDREATKQCPKGSECPEGSSHARICSAGSFSDEEGLTQCKVCPERYFCVMGTIRPQECPAGYYCPLQTPSGTSFPCPPGTFSNQSSLASAVECTKCPPGEYCSGEPPTDSPTGRCAPGYFCAGGANSSQPVDSITGGRCAGGFMCFGGAWDAMPIDNKTGRACDTGFYCLEGSSSQTRCPKGTFNSFEKQTACVLCPAGSYCDTNTTAPVPCPQRYFCPEGTIEPIVCPSGTFGHQVGLERADQCAACNAGKYCTGGVQTASCAAGYYCKMFNAEPNPALASNTSRIDYGGPCPVGHYCPEGVLDPFPCPNFTARMETHGSSVDDCSLCPAGMSCEDGAATIPCPRGSYCLYGKSAVSCPAGTYNPLEGRQALEDCLPCIAGKLCNRTGVIDPRDYDCPPGYYCLAGESAPRECPTGRFRRDVGGKSAEDCQLCTGGSYCVLGSVEPNVCENKTYCPVGSGLPLSCPGGSYCPFNSSTPTLCPEGHFCPAPSDLPVLCDRGYYCPTGTVAQIPCPLGYIGRKTPLSGAYTILSDSCESCPPGMFGADPNRLQCDVCLEGYVCLGATTSSRPLSRSLERGYQCPPGHYCPSGSSREIACPSGSYQPDLGATNSTFCRECPANSYQNLAGQISCLPCSKSAYSAAGATKCTCIGSHRAFQMTDGYCICEPGYEFYDQDLILRSDEDDDVDCQPIVYDRCGSNQVRSESGSCVSTAKVSCESTCNNGTGTYVSSLGLCQCDRQPDLDVICNEECRKRSKQIQVNSETGKLQLYDPTTDQVEAIDSTDSSRGIVAKVSCATSSCQLHSISLTTTGFSGSYGVPSSLSGSSESRRRRLLSDADQSISNPMVCLSVGSGIMFDLSSPNSYPVYLKDSMLNTNPSFDYGAFRSLATKIKSNTSSVTAFAFTFSEPGVYVFGNSLNSAAKTVVAVMSDGTKCPTDGPIVPLNEKNLIAVSARRRTDDMILAPDWGLIIGLLGGLFGIIAAIIGGLYYFRTTSWTNSGIGKKIAGYKAKSRRTDLTAIHSKGSLVTTKTTVVGAEHIQAEAAELKRLLLSALLSSAPTPTEIPQTVDISTRSYPLPQTVDTSTRSYPLPQTVDTSTRNSSLPVDTLVRLTEKTASGLVESQASMRAQYHQSLGADFPQLLPEDKERLLGEFSSDLQQVASSLSVEATKSQEAMKTLVTAQTLVREKQQRLVQEHADEFESVIMQQQKAREEQLEKQFKQEELEIEKAYKEELSRLEQEFEESEGDFEELEEDYSAPSHDEGADDQDGVRSVQSLGASTPEVQHAVDKCISGLEEKIAACRAAHDRDLSNLRIAMDAERQQKRMALDERLARKKLGQKESTLTAPTSEDNQPPRDEEDKEAAEEVAVLEASLARKEADLVAELHMQVTEALKDVIASAKKENQQRAEASKAACTHVEDELNRVRAEHRSALSDITNAQASERKRQHDALAERLSKRRAANLSKPGTRDTDISETHTSEVSEEEAIEIEQLDRELDEQAARAASTEIEHFKARERELTERLQTLQLAVEASSAACSAVDTAGDAELERLRKEYFDSRARSSLEENGAAAASRERLKARLAGKQSVQREERTSDNAEVVLVENEARKVRLDTQESQAQDENFLVREQNALAECDVVCTDELLELTRTLTRAKEHEASAKVSEQEALDELARITQEHREQLDALQATMNAEKERQSLALSDRLQKRRDARLRELKAEGASDTDAFTRLQAEEQQEHLEFAETLLAHNSDAIARELERQRAIEQDLRDRATRASLLAAEAEAARKEAERAHALESKRIQDEYRQQRGDLASNDNVQRQQQKQGLLDRLAARKAKKRGVVDSSAAAAAARDEDVAAVLSESDRSEDQLNARDNSFEQEIQRVKEAHDAGWKARLSQLELDAAMKKARLAERMQKKRETALYSMKDEVDQAAMLEVLHKDLEREEVDALSAIEAELQSQKAQLQNEMEAGERAVEAAVDAAAKDKMDELERLLAKCRDTHADELEKLRMQQALDRQQQEMSLQARLAKKRAQKLATRSSSDNESPEVATATVDAELREEEQQERAAIAKTQEAEEAAALTALEDKHREEMSAVMQQLDAEAEHKRAAALQQQQDAARQLELLQQEHRESIQELNDALSAQKAQQESKLQQRLLSKRAKKREELEKMHAGDQEAEQAMNELDKEQAEQQARFALEWEAEVSRKLKEAADLQQAREQEVARLLSQAALDAAAAEATRKALEVASRAEIDRVASEFQLEASAAKVQEALEAKGQRQRLQDRLAEKKQKRTALKHKLAQDATGDHQLRSPEVVADVDSSDHGATSEQDRLKLEREVQALAQQAELAARKKQTDAEQLQQQAEKELERLKEEHENEMKNLNTSLQAEQKRQEQKLQERIAQRRERKQKEVAYNEAEKERLAAQLEEEERKEREALEAKLAARAAQVLQEERERQATKEAELAARIDRAAIEAAEAEAARKAVEAAREREIERLSREFDEKSKELRQSDQADLATQKKKLEARIAAKKQKKLMELEAKKELELQKLKEKQAKELEAIKDDQVKATRVLEEFSIRSSDESAPRPPAQSSDTEQSLASLQTTSDGPVKEEGAYRQQRNNALSDIRQQASDIAAIEQLFMLGLIPRQLSLMAGVELVVSQRHQMEASTLLANQYEDKVAASRKSMNDIIQQKAAAKALALSESDLQAHEKEARLQSIEVEFDRKIRDLEHTVMGEIEQRQLAQTAALKQRQLAQIELLVGHFAARQAAATAEIIAQQAGLSSPPLLRRQGTHAVVSSDAESEHSDVINELRARLQVEKNVRIKELMDEKRTRIQESDEQLERDLADLALRFTQLVEAERVEIEKTFNARLEQLLARQNLGSSAKETQRRKFESEKDAQVARLVLMLRGRQTKHADRLQKLADKRRAMIEDEFAQKVQVVTAKMLQRVVEEKETLTRKRAIVEGDVGSVGTLAVPQDDDRRGALAHADVLEERLARIEDMLRERLVAARGSDDAAESRSGVATASSSTPEQGDSDAPYRTALADAILRGWRVSSDFLPSDRTTLSRERVAALQSCSLPAEAINESMQKRLDFVSFVVQLAGPRTPSEISETPEVDAYRPPLQVALVQSLSDASDGVTFHSYVDDVTQTLYLDAACLAQLTTGQLAVLALHALAQSCAKRADVSDPLFLSKLYGLLVQCYQGLFQWRAAESPAMPSALAESESVTLRRSAAGSTKPPSASPASATAQWQSRLVEVETFLSTLERGSAVLNRSSSGLAAAELSASQRLLLPPPGVAATAEAEQRQLLQEQLDATEKRYTQALRQCQEQHESLEYLRELLADGEEATEGESGSAQETRREVAALEQALAQTRGERDELFAQCQALRDALRHPRA